MLPSLNMLGFASSRYRDDSVLSGHVEWRYKFHPRWTLMTAYEAGSVGEDFEDIFDTDWVNSLGAGIRWQVFADRNIHIGLDYGVSEDDEALYIQVGERF